MKTSKPRASCENPDQKRKMTYQCFFSVRLATPCQATMVAIPFNAAASTASGLSHSRQPHDQTPLLQSDQTGHVPKGRPSELHPASKLVDEEARSNASEAIKEDVNAKSVKGIAGVISVLILGTHVHGRLNT